MNSWRGQQPGQMQGGFSTIELMVVLAIAAILVTMAVPGFQVMLRSARLSSAVNELFTSVNLTRAEAITRGRRVDMIPADGQNWTSGWTVFVDEDADQVPDAGEPIIFSRGALPGEIGISTTFAAASPQYLAYNGTGHTRSNASAQATRSGSWLLTLEGQRRKVIVNFLGRARVCNPDKDTSC